MNTNYNLEQLAQQIKAWGNEFGFQQIGITDIDLTGYEKRLLDWLHKKFHGNMHYMEKHGTKRSRPADLFPGTLRVITARINYYPPAQNAIDLLHQSKKAYISRYALGKDYHKFIRRRLTALAKKVNDEIVPHGFRAFCDSAPVLEKALAEKSGLGWIGKHTNLIHKKTGSWFFLGEIYTNILLPIDQPAKNHCGTCTACMDICPTQAIVAPYQLDARRCISYLTIELRESIPVELRPLIGNRIYGCDDCQLFCPWNRFARFTDEHAFHPRHHLDTASLLELFAWSEQDFLNKTEGSAIRRIGYVCWLRNIAVALGNAPSCPEIMAALQSRANHPSDLVREHVHWALTNLS